MRDRGHRFRAAGCKRRWACRDADLQAGAIFNLDGDAARNGAIDFARLRIWQLRRWIAVAFDDVIDFAEMNAVLVSAGIGEAFAHSTITILARSITARCHILEALKLKQPFWSMGMS